MRRRLRGSSKLASVALATMAFLRPAFASSDFLLLPLYGNASTETVRIRIFSETKCREIIEAAYSPKVAVEAALEALHELNSPSLKEPVGSCLDILTSDPSKVLSGEFKKQSTEGLEVFQDPYSPFEYDRSKYLALKEKVKCYDSAFNPASPKAAEAGGGPCEGKWFSSNAEYLSLQKEMDLEDDKYHRALSEYEGLRDVGRGIHSLLRAQTNFSSEAEEKYAEFEKKLQCSLSENAHAASYQKKEYGKACAGKWLSSNQRKAILKARADWEVDYQARKAKAAAANNLLREFLSYHGTYDHLDRKDLSDRYKKLRCYNPFKKGTIQYLHRNESKLTYCGNRDWLPEKEWEEGMRELRAKFGDLDARLAEWPEKRKKLLAAAMERDARENGEREDQYAHWRLLGAYRASFAKGRGDVATFCREFRARDLRDQKYFANKLLAGSTLNSNSWKMAVKHGLSEAEYGAIVNYMGSYFTEINPALYLGMSLTESQQLYKEVMDAGLAKMPAYTEPVRRHLRLSGEYLAKHQVGATICNAAYSSASKKKDWSWRGNVQMLIQPHARGRAIFEIEDGEGEVLFEAGTCFKVIAREESATKHDGTRTRLVMQEVGGAEISPNAWSSIDPPKPEEAEPPKALPLDLPKQEKPNFPAYKPFSPKPGKKAGKKKGK